MGLSIIVKNKVKPFNLNGRQITYDEFEDMSFPDKTDFAYLLHSDLYIKDQAIYDKIIAHFENADGIDYFDIGYGSFNCFREIILRNCGVEMYSGKWQNGPGVKIKEICPCFTHWVVDDYYYHTDLDYIEDDAKAIDFLMDKSDCDGEYPNLEIKRLAKLIKDFPLRKRCKDYLKRCDRYDEYVKFVKFIQKYAQTDCYFAFC